MNIAQNVERAALHFPRKAALLFEGQEISFGELNELANRVASTLGGLGVRPGDRVALLLPNIPAFAYSYLGVQKSGAIAVPLNVMLTQRGQVHPAGFVLQGHLMDF